MAQQGLPHIPLGMLLDDVLRQEIAYAALTGAGLRTNSGLAPASVITAHHPTLEPHNRTTIVGNGIVGAPLSFVPLPIVAAPLADPLVPTIGLVSPLTGTQFQYSVVPAAAQFQYSVVDPYAMTIAPLAGTQLQYPSAAMFSAADPYAMPGTVGVNPFRG